MHDADETARAMRERDAKILTDAKRGDLQRMVRTNA